MYVRCSFFGPYLNIDLINQKLYNKTMDKFSALADPTRRKIMEMLASHGPLNATQISDQFRVSPPAISQHLKILREAQLVRMEKRAQQRIYHINPEAVSELEDWAQQMVRRWNTRFDALDQLLAAEKRDWKENPNDEFEYWYSGSNHYPYLRCPARAGL
jgi:DNA-binding transcriptional ArsR family regulator